MHVYEPIAGYGQPVEPSKLVCQVPTDEIARLLGVNLCTVRNWMRARRLPRIRIGRMYLANVDEVMNAVKPVENPNHWRTGGGARRNTNKEKTAT